MAYTFVERTSPLCPFPALPHLNRAPQWLDQGSLGTCGWSRRWRGSDGNAQTHLHLGTRTGPAEPPGLMAPWLGLGVVVCAARAEGPARSSDSLPVTLRRLRTFWAAGSVMLPVSLLPFVPLKKCLYGGRGCLVEDLLLEPLLRAQNQVGSRVEPSPPSSSQAEALSPLDTHPFPSLSPRPSRECVMQAVASVSPRSRGISPLWVQAVSWAGGQQSLEGTAGTPLPPAGSTACPVDALVFSPAPRPRFCCPFVQLSFCSRTFHWDLYDHDSPALMQGGWSPPHASG